MTQNETRAFNYLKMVRGLSTAEWAFRERNGTWDEALEAIEASDNKSIYDDPKEQPPE